MTQPSLVIKRKINASPSKVFSAWSNNDLIRQWVLPVQNWTITSKSKHNFKEGGEYFLQFTDVEGNVYEHTGQYVKIVPDEKIVYTWNMYNAPDTTVTIEILSSNEVTANDLTEVTLTHEFFPNEEIRNRYHEGWQNCFNKLEELLAKNK